MFLICLIGDQHYNRWDQTEYDSADLLRQFGRASGAIRARSLNKSLKI